MIYILDQRLKAQNVSQSKSEKGMFSPTSPVVCFDLCKFCASKNECAVVQDIVGQMFDVKCVKELFHPQKVLSTSSLKVIFSKLAHSSIMKLNEAAMDKVRSARQIQYGVHF